MKLDAFGFKPVGRFAVAPFRHPQETSLGWDVEKDREIWTHVCDRDPLQFKDEGGIKFSEGTLISPRSVGKAIRYNPSPTRERRFDGLVHVIDASRGKQDRFT